MHDNKKKSNELQVLLCFHSKISLTFWKHSKYLCKLFPFFERSQLVQSMKKPSILRPINSNVLAGSSEWEKHTEKKWKVMRAALGEKRFVNFQAAIRSPLKLYPIILYNSSAQSIKIRGPLLGNFSLHIPLRLQWAHYSTFIIIFILVLTAMWGNSILILYNFLFKWLICLYIKIFIYMQQQQS